MGEARRRGSFNTRKEQAISEGRIKQDQSGLIKNILPAEKIKQPGKNRKEHKVLVAYLVKAVHPLAGSADAVIG
jgi:hypothetical protein